VVVDAPLFENHKKMVENSTLKRKPSKYVYVFLHELLHVWSSAASCNNQRVDPDDVKYGCLRAIFKDVKQFTTTLALATKEYEKQIGEWQYNALTHDIK